jgi:hypothetical protein
LEAIGKTMSEKGDQRDTEGASADFKVADRRKFTPEGEVIEENAESHHHGPSFESTSTSDRGPAFSVNTGASEAQPQKIDFPAFLLSLATSAMAHLGEVPDPATGEKSENLGAAQQMIDILSLLKEKTQGNLEADEDRLLEDLLYELRMKYLHKAKIISA